MKVKVNYGRGGKWFSCMECGIPLNPHCKSYLIHPFRDMCPDWWPLRWYKTLKCRHIGEVVDKPSDEILELKPL